MSEEDRRAQEEPQEPHDTPTPYTRNEEMLPDRRQGQPLTPEQKAMVQDVFLEEFSKQANVTAACEAAGVHRSTPYRWVHEDPEFASKWQVAEERANDVLRKEAYRRGVEGYTEPVISLGKVVYGPDGEIMTVRKYSDLILLTLMRARMPEYRDSRHVDVNNNINVASVSSQHLTLDVRCMSAEELSQVKQIAQAMKDREQAREERQ